MKKNNSGFTLIELLVVIAIIGILSSVVLSSLNSARDKGKDASAKSELASVRAQALLYFDDNEETYGIDGTSCTNSTSVFDPGEVSNISVLVSSAETKVGSTAVCANSSDAYVVGLPLMSGDNWCIDSTGFSGTTTTAITGSPSDLQNALACQ